MNQSMVMSLFWFSHCIICRFSIHFFNLFPSTPFANQFQWIQCLQSRLIEICIAHKIPLRSVFVNWHISTGIDLLSTYCIKLYRIRRTVQRKEIKEGERVEIECWSVENSSVRCECICVCLCYPPCVLFCSLHTSVFMQFPINGITIIVAERFFYRRKTPATCAPLYSKFK